MSFYTFIVFFIILFSSSCLLYFFIIERQEVLQSHFKHIFWCQSCGRFEPGATKNDQVICPTCGKECKLVKF